METKKLITELLNDSNIESLFKTNEINNGNERYWPGYFIMLLRNWRQLVLNNETT